MDKELPARIWVPILAACALVPLALFNSHLVGTLLFLGVIGVGGYFAVNAIRHKQRWLAVGYVVGALFVGGMITDATKPPPTPQELAAQEQPKAKAEAPVDCPALRAAIIDAEARINYAKSAIAADDTLAADAKVNYTLNQLELAKTFALGKYTRRCQS